MRSLCNGQSLPSETTRSIAFGLPSQVHSYRINTPLFSLCGSLWYLCRYYYSRSTVWYRLSISPFPTVVKHGERQCAASNSPFRLSAIWATSVTGGNITQLRIYHSNNITASTALVLSLTPHYHNLPPLEKGKVDCRQGTNCCFVAFCLRYPCLF